VDVYRYRLTFPFIAICAQCSAGGNWSADGPDARNALAILAEVLEECGGDPDRVCLTGVSAGGAGVWQLAAARPELFAALWPISTQCPVDLQHVIENNIPVWSFYKGSDRRELVDSARKAHASLIQGGLSPIVTEYDRSGHDAWTEAYRSTVVFDWLLEQSRNRNLAGGKFRPWRLSKIRTAWPTAPGEPTSDALAGSIGAAELNKELTDISPDQTGDCELHAEFQLHDGATCKVEMLDSSGQWVATVEIEHPAVGTGRIKQVNEQAKSLDAVAQRSIRPGWNDLRISKSGQRIQMRVNGYTAAEFLISVSLPKCCWAIQVPIADEFSCWRNIRTRESQDLAGDAR